MPELRDGLTACRRASEDPDWGLRWGVDFVEFSGASYQPEPSGEPAVIVSAVDTAYQPIDLVACAWRGQRMATRCGCAAALGEDWIEFTRGLGGQLTLLSHPILWLAMRCAGAVIVDWRLAPELLEGIESVFCDTRSLAQRVHAVTRRLEAPPRLFFPQRSLRP